MTDTRLAPSVRSAGTRVPRRLAYQPALDGVRAVAVIAVVAFHAGAGWAPGGYLGVSVFFTLSGYLITTVLLAEHAATGRIALGRFVGRRVRRLAPASLLTLATLTVLAIAGVGTVATDLPRHIRWAAAHLANWDQLTASSTYADAVTGAAERSPVLHFWSLAIEEQFYLVWPIMMLAGLAILRRVGVRHFVVIPAVALGASWLFVATLANAGEAEQIYLNSGSRAAEILTGCVLAAVLQRRSSIVPSRLQLAPICAVLILVAVVVTGSSSDAWPYRGGLPVFALLSAGLIAGLARPSRFSEVVGSAPLVWVGRRSYGIYLYHWPIFVMVPLVDAGVAAHALRLVAVVLVASLSYRWIEQPIRTRSMSAARTAALAVGGAAVVIAATFLIDAGPAAIMTTDDIDADGLTAVQISDEPEAAVVETPVVNGPTSSPTSSATSPESTSPSTTEATPDAAAAAAAERPTVAPSTEAPPADPDPFRMVVVGDSTALAVSAGLIDWAERSNGEVQVGIAAHGACGLVRGGQFRIDIFNVALIENCPRVLDEELPAILETAPVDLVVVMVTLADTWARSWDDGATWSRPTDPANVEMLRRDYAAFVDRVTMLGARKVVFVRPPVSYYSDDLDEPLSEWSSGAQQVVDDTVAAMATERADVAVLDMRAFFESSGFDADHIARPDGIHLSTEGSVELAQMWLGPALSDLQDP